MRIIFLDIDGVMTTGRHARTLFYQGKREGRRRTFDPYAVRWLNELTASTEASLVISSIWRGGRDITTLQAILRAQGVTGHVLDKTPHLGWSIDGIHRGHEIQYWLDRAMEIESFVILDDDSDMAHLLPHLVKTKCQYGLTRQKAREAKRHLMEYGK
jgi:hypothetical protein